MGFLDSLFGGKSELETKLVELYSHIYAQMGMSSREAKSTVKDMMKKAKENARALGREDHPPNLGDALLKGEEAVPGLFSFMEQARRDGATDEDIRQWWNMHELERQMVIQHDNVSRMGVFVTALQQDMKPDEAAARVRKTFPMYGDPVDNEITQGEDRPLPFELKDRVNRWTESTATEDFEEFKRRKEEGTSFNAVVRAAIRVGEL